MPGDEKDHSAPHALDADQLYRIGLALRFETDNRCALLLADLPREYVANLPTACMLSDRLRNELLELSTTDPLDVPALRFWVLSTARIEAVTSENLAATITEVLAQYPNPQNPTDTRDE